MKRTFKILLLVFFISTIYSYILVISNIPNHITLINGEKMHTKTLLGINIRESELETIQTSAENEKSKLESENSNELNLVENITKKKAEVDLLGLLKIKEINIDILPETTVIPNGKLAGVKLYTNGVLVVGMTEIKGDDNKKYKPYENTGITEGDTIIKIDNKQINSTEDLIKNVNISNGKEIKIEYIHEE